jgi:hypothetical protein
MDTNRLFCSYGRLVAIAPASARFHGNTFTNGGACPECRSAAGGHAGENPVFGFRAIGLLLGQGGTDTPGSGTLPEIDQTAPGEE